MKNLRFTFARSFALVFIGMLLSTTVSSQTVGLQVDSTHRVLFGQDTSGAGFRLIWFPEKAAFRAGELVDLGPGQDTYWNSNNIGTHSVAFGLNTLASDVGSMAWGDNNRAEGQNATAWGQANNAQSGLSTAWGNGNTASGEFSTVWGVINVASGFYSTAWGQNNTASWTTSTAWGNQNEANGNASTAWGVGNRSESLAETVLGRYADISNNPNKDNFESDDQLLAIGNGTSLASTNNAFTILKNGETYFHSQGDQDSSLFIGFREGPKYGMDGTKNLNDGGVGDVGEDKGFVIESNHREANFESSGIYLDGDQVIIWSPGDNDRLLSVYDEDGGGVERWYVDGDGDDFKASDKRYKKNITALQSPVVDLMKISGNKYQWKDISSEKSQVHPKSHTDSYKYGVIAQEVQKVFPELVQTNRDGYMFVDYKGFIPILIEVCKGQQTEIEEMKSVLKRQEELIATLLSKMDSSSQSDQ